MTSQSFEPEPGGSLELPVAGQLARARPWEPTSGPLLDDLTDEEEAEFLDAIARR